LLTHPTLDRLNALGLTGMAKAFIDIESNGDAASLGHAEWLALLLEREASLRHDKRLATRLRHAKLRQQACVEDIDYQHPRGLQKATMLDLGACRWVEAHQNVIFTGQTGVGKSYLACALGQKACREGYSVAYRRASRLLDELAQARADGSHFQLLRRLAKTDVLIVDDFGMEVLSAAQRKDFLEVVEDRYGTSSTVITSQLDPKNWHPVIGDETIADAVCDRLVHNAPRVKLTGESIRKVKGDLTKAQKPAK
jgi:DNA replication protein DnaC